ncbi:unnamed protein product [Trifolium pratense]|uniref:Uncharacterized protein n=1 Tax=Trifolium pratense TaxID=57577 RepID=A0ACB0LM56_TRIPR|nr:unnamed protein product [Trifolium pratense]
MHRSIDSSTKREQPQHLLIKFPKPTSSVSVMISYKTTQQAVRRNFKLEEIWTPEVKLVYGLLNAPILYKFYRCSYYTLALHIQFVG